MTLAGPLSILIPAVWSGVSVLLALVVCRAISIAEDRRWKQ